MNHYILSIFLTFLSFSYCFGQEPSANIDVKFYHIDVEVSLDKSYIKGILICDFVAIKSNVKMMELDLADQLKVSKIEGAAAFQQKDNKLEITLETEYAVNQAGSIKIFYEGVPPVIKGENGVDKGLIYSTHGKKDNPVIATVCYPSGAYLWFPCKRGISDKADSVYIDITIEDKKVEAIFVNPKTEEEEFKETPIIAVSNGKLEGVVELGENKKKYQWRHRAPIAPHHVLLAISNYMKAESEFKGRGYKFPIDFYLFSENIQQSTAFMNRVPEIMACLTNTFGQYPFSEECFNVTEVGIPMGLDGMPTQTNVLLEDMKTTNLYRVVHQMAAMWFGNHISPKEWQDAWIVEALAAYAEGIWQEYKRGLTVYQMILDQKEYFEGGKLYLDDHKDYSEELLNKKGMYVIHMLRGVMTDPYFFETLKAITSGKRMKGDNKTYLSTENFQEICEYYASENIERDYTYFFDQWVRGEYYPNYIVSYSVASGKLTLNVKQNERSTTPSIYNMPYKIEIVLEDGTIQKEILGDKNNDPEFYKANQKFEIPVTAAVKELRFDPDNWIFKDLQYVRYIMNEKFGLTNVEIIESDYRRKLEVKYNVSKTQDITIELIQVADGIAFTEDKSVTSQTFKKESGAQTHLFKIPVSLTNQGVYKLVISSKGEVYTKTIRAKRIKSSF